MQLTNYILDSGTTFHMTSEISDFMPGSLVETDKYVNVEYTYFGTSKQTGEVQIKMGDNNRKPFIATRYNVLFAIYLYNRLFSII